MGSRQDISISGSDWVSINAAVDPVEGVIPIGTGMEIQLKGTYPILLWESSSKPSSEFDEGRILTNISHPYAIATVLAGSEEIWAKCVDEGSSKIHVQVI